VTTLSRSLALFFGGHLNTICGQEKYRNNVSIIYSGGDDLFIVGAWNLVVELAEEIRSEFKAFCNNPTFTISGGVSITQKKYPIYRGAKHAGDAENKAKKLKDKEGKEKKDAFTFLNKPLRWNDFKTAVQIKRMLCDCIENGKSSAISSNENIRMSKGILDRLRRIYLLYEKNRTYWQGKESLTPNLIKEKIGYHKWVWRSVYSLDKAERENSLFKEELSLLKTALFENRFKDEYTERDVIEFIDIPARWAEFMLRKEV
jgi:CRISPR-associated protein Csm1